MRENDKASPRNRIFLIGFIIVAIASIVVCILSKQALENTTDGKIAETNMSTKQQTEKKDTATDETIDSENENSQTESVSQTEMREIPMKFAFSSMGKEIVVNQLLDKSVNKTFKIDLNKFAAQDDQLNSFVFVFYSQDGVSNMGEVKGGFGISLDNTCPVATDPGWFQSEDFSVRSEGAYCEVTWTIPDNIKEYIDNNGKLMIGYWWSDVESVNLERIVCNKTSFKELPTDGEKYVDINKIINYGDSSLNVLNIPLSQIIGENEIPQYIAISVQGAVPMGKFSGALGISTQKGIYDGFYQEDNIVQYSEIEKMDIEWIIPDEIKNNIDYNGNLQLSFWWNNNQELNVNNIYVQYCNK